MPSCGDGDGDGDGDMDGDRDGDRDGDGDGDSPMAGSNTHGPLGMSTCMASRETSMTDTAEPNMLRLRLRLRLSL